MGLYFRKGIWVALLLFAIAAAAGFGWVHYGAEARDLAANGVTVQGTITDKTETVTHRRKRADTHHYYFDVRFDTEAGPQNIRAGVDRAFWDTHFIGSEIPVTYLPSDPAIFEAQPGAMAKNASGAGWVGLGALLFGVGAAWFTQLAVKAHRGLRDRGQRATAQVTFSKAEKGKRTMDFTFVDAKGMTIKATSVGVPISKVGPPPPPGTQIDVIFDPESPKGAMPLDQFTP